MNTIADYQAWRASRDKSNVGAAQTVLGSVEASPDEVAGDLTLATEFGKATGNPVPPPPLVREYRNTFQKAVDQHKATTILSSSPRLTDWLRNPENAAVARDDLESLSWWEGGLRATGRALGRGVSRLPQSYNQWLAYGAAERFRDQGRSFGEIVADQTAFRGATGEIEFQASIPNPLDLFMAGSRFLSSRLTSALGYDEQAAAAYYQQQAGEIAQRIATIPMSETGERYRQALTGLKPSGDVLADLSGFTQTVAADPAGFLAFLAETAVESAPSIAAATAVTAATRSPTAGAFALGGLSGGIEAGTAPVEFFAEHGVDVSTPEGAQAAIQNETLMRDAASRGLTRGVVIGIMDGLSGGVAGQTLAKSPLGNLALQSVVQAVFGASGEAMAELASGQQFNIADVLVEGLAEFVTTPIEVAGVGGRAFLDNQRKAREAEDRRAVFEALSGQATASKLRERLPDRFRDFVAAATANGPVENLYIPAQEFVGYFQGIGVDPFTLIDELEGVTRDDLDAALAGGGDLQIPTATYAAKIAGSEHDVFLIDNMRFDPDQFTAREAAEFNARAQEAMQEAWEVAEDMRLQEESLRSFEAEIYDTMVSRLREAGRSTDVATTEAMLYPAFYRVMAERSGLTTEEFLARYPLPKIEGSIPEGMQLRDVDEFTRTLESARSRKKTRDTRQTLLEFIDAHGGIVDDGGELRARDAEVIRRGRGKKNLRLARGGLGARIGDMFGGARGKAHGADDVALAAIEAGYLADDPIANEYRAAVQEGREVPDITAALWRAIDRELRGEAQYAADPDADVAEAERLDEIEAYLGSLGVSLDDDDAAIRSAVQGAQGQMYGQDGAMLTESAAFKAWFGDSKVVDESGAPLVVYHGTDRTFEEFDTVDFGSWFGVDPKTANRYTDKNDGEASQIYPVYLRIERPFVIPKDIDLSSEYSAKEIIDALNKENGTDLQPENFVYYEDRDDVTGYMMTAMDDEFIDSIKALGFDGISAYEQGELTFNAFSKGQIKSVFNRGTFDPADPRILHQRAYHGTPHLFDRFMLDHIGRGEGNQAFGWGLYFAGKKEVAAYYREKLSAEYRTEEQMSWSGKSAVQHYEAADRRGEYSKMLVLERIMLHQPKSEIEAYLREAIAEDSDDRQSREALDYLNSLPNEAFPKTAGRLLTVEIPDDSDLLDLEKTLDKQPPKVKALLRGAGLVKEFRENLSDFSSPQQSRGKGRGENLYAYLSWKLGSDEAASRRLLEIGIPGHRYPAGTIANVSGAGSNYVIYDDARVQVLSFEQSGDANARGQIQFPAAGVGNGETIIRLFESADLSTFVHESGHYFLTVMQDMARRGEPSALEDYAAIRAWWRENAADVARDGKRVAAITAEDVIAALDAGTTGDVLKDAAVDVGMQEQWARAFEAYLMEGKAPSADLRTAFEKFRAWLISIYQRVAGLHVKPSDDLRRVFDRMLASDQEIAEAQGEIGGTAPIFATAEQMGLSEAEYAAFLKLRGQAEEDAKARLLREVMAPIKREREKWYREERAKVREEVEREVNAYPYFRALEWMGNRRWLGEDEPADMPDIRLSKDVLVERYGAGVLKTLPRGKQTIYAVENGIDPDDAAGWFGFDSGDEMIRALEKAPKRSEAIDAETDRIMRDRHGDVLNDGSIEAEALDAVHTDKRGQWLAAELKAVVEVADQGEALTAKEARAIARQTISRMRVRDGMNANRFLAAERKAGEEAARLAAMLAREKIWMDNARRRIATKTRAALREDGTPDAVAGQVEQANRSTGNYNETLPKLIAAKRRQLLNHALYAEARKVADEVEKAERYVAGLNKKTKREKIAGAGRRENAQVDYLSAIDEILERYDFRRLSGVAEGRRGSLNAYVEAMKAAGRENELAIPEHVLADAARKPYKTMAVEELRGVIDSLKNLEHSALRWNKLIDRENQRELDEVVEDIVGAFDANLPKRPPGRVGTRIEALRNAGRQFLDLVLNATTILREIDGFADLGPAYRNLKAPIDAAMNRLAERRKKAAADLESLYAVYSKAERRRMAVREHIPELGYALSKWEMIAVALNTGNAGNRQRLTDPKVRGSLTEGQVAAVLGRLDARDADFVQSVWDYVNSFWPDIAERERRATGTAPDKVDGEPVEIAGKVLRGGYYPLKYDPRLSSLARDDETQEIAQSLQAGRFGKAQTKNGHLKERAQSSGRDVELDMGVLHRHINQVIYDLELSEPVANSWRILQDGRVRGAFMEAGKQADFDALEIWLKDVAEGEQRSADLVGRGARSLKSNFTAAKLALNLSTVMVQITGLSQTMVVVGKKDFARSLHRAFRPGVREEIVAKSPFMAERQTTFNKDIFDFYSDPKTGPVASRWGDFKSSIMGPLAFWLMTKVQFHLVDVPTWLAGYHQGLRKFGGDEAQAVAHADGVVKRAQASGLFADRSMVERGSVSNKHRQSDVVRLFTTLASYMFAKFNVAYERSGRASKSIRAEGLSLKSAQEVFSWTLDMAFLFTLEAVIVAAIKGRLPDDDDDEDEGWLAFLAKETGFGVLGTIPFVRDVASTVSGFEGGGAYGGITKEFAAPFKQAAQGEIDRAFVKSIINATGLVTGAPSTQINRAVDAGWREVEGEDVSPLEYILGRMGR